MERKANERARAPKAWIREGTEEEPVDFLDPGVVQRVVGRSLDNIPFLSCFEPQYESEASCICKRDCLVVRQVANRDFTRPILSVICLGMAFHCN